MSIAAQEKGYIFDASGKKSNRNVLTSKGKLAQLIPFKFNILTLNKYIGYVFKKDKLINRKSLSILRQMLDITDMRFYEVDDKLMARFDFIRSGLKGRLDKGIEDIDLLLDFAQSDSQNEHNEEIVNNLPLYRRLTRDDILYVNSSVSERVQYAYIHYYKELFNAVFEDLESGNFHSYADIINRTKYICQLLLSDIRRTEAITNDSTFSLEDTDMLDKVKTMVENLKSPRRVFRTGIQDLNDCLVEGYQATRLYMYLGLPAGFKSGMLLKSVIDIKLYNKDVAAENPGKRKTVLMVTMENTLEESIERIFNMYIDSDSIVDLDQEYVINEIRRNNIFKLEGPDDIDFVIIYKANMSISTDDLYTIMEDLEDSGREVIALILDYIKRIRPAMPAKDEKEELKNVTNELKALAIFKDIPVITAHQLNRDAASRVDNASINDQEDLGRLIGRSNVGTAWEVMENSDWACALNVELKKGTGEYYLTFNRLKLRYRDPYNKTYFNHPFGNSTRIMLMDDVMLDERLSVSSISTDFEGIVGSIDKNIGNKGKLNAVERIVSENSSADIFDFSKRINRAEKETA